jgi:hypothetical protein
MNLSNHADYLGCFPSPTVVSNAVKNTSGWHKDTGVFIIQESIQAAGTQWDTGVPADKPVCCGHFFKTQEWNQNGQSTSKLIMKGRTVK